MLIAQISDLHVLADGTLLNGVVDTQSTLAAAIDHIGGLDPRPDLVLATGDLTQDGRPEDYALLRSAFGSLPMPVYVIPGNHDNRTNLRAAFTDQGYLPETGEFLHYAVDRYPLRLIGLDTVIDGDVGGRMCPARMQWLDERLSEQPDRPTVIFMHHPPFATGIAFMDRPSFKGAQELETLIRRFPAVRLITCGHVHRAIQTRWAGVLATVAPSIVFQMALELAEGAPSAFVVEPPAISLHLWRDGEGPIVLTSLIGDFGPRHRFHMEPV